MNVEGGIIPSRVFDSRNTVGPGKLCCTGAVQRVSCVFVVLPSSAAFAERIDRPVCSVCVRPFEICMLGSVVTKRQTNTTALHQYFPCESLG